MIIVQFAEARGTLNQEIVNFAICTENFIDGTSKRILIGDFRRMSGKIRIVLKNTS